MAKEAGEKPVGSDTSPTETVESDTLSELRRLLAEKKVALEASVAREEALADILSLINASAGYSQPVFDAILKHSHNLCDATLGSLQIADGELFRAVATQGLDEEFSSFMRRGYKAMDVLLPQKESVEILDVVELAKENKENSVLQAAASGMRTLLCVPLIKDERIVGRLFAGRREVRLFTKEQKNLLEIFAEQAMLAMENAHLLGEQREALERQTAMAEVLATINTNPGDLQPVFDIIVRKSVQLIGCDFGVLNTFDGADFHAKAHFNARELWDGFLHELQHPEPGTAFSRLVEGDDAVHVHDVREDPLYATSELRRKFADLSGARTAIWIALRKDKELFGALLFYRTAVNPFRDEQVNLLKSFAGHAVMAMENARLITEQRELLERQAAAAEVLASINVNPGNLQPIFDIIIDKSVKLCGCEFGVINIFDGTNFHTIAHVNSHALWEKNQETELRPEPGNSLEKLIKGENIVHVHDVCDSSLYATSEQRQKFIDLTGARTAIWIALRKNKELFGALMFYRTSVSPFSNRQIELLKGFADQAVIAMENARLLAEQHEALRRQTATAEVLVTINASPSDPQPVFDVILDKAHEICGADMGALTAFDGELFRVMALHGFPQDYWDVVSSGIPAEDVSTLKKLVAGERCTRHPDLKASDIEGTTDYGRKVIRYLKDRTNIRSTLMVPMRKDGQLLGYITAYRTEVCPFSDKDLELLENFASQAVIAIENARLLGELHQRTDEVADLNRGLEARVAAQVEELGRVGRLKRFLAPQLAELIVSQGDEKILESHRREIVVVFCDLRGYTAFTETAEPEEVLDFLRAYHGALGPLVAGHEGTLDQFSGDGIMVFFNDPVPIADPAERAVKMALAMRESANDLILVWRKRGRELGFGIGIAQGYATLGQIGFSERAGYTAIGTVCNVAARLCAAAKDGQILLSQRVNADLNGSVVTEEIGTLELKGLAQPVMAFNVPTKPGQPTLRMIDGGDPQSV